jgi:hypothetical protein
MSNPQYHSLRVRISSDPHHSIICVSLEKKSSFGTMYSHLLYYSRHIRGMFMVCIFYELMVHGNDRQMIRQDEPHPHLNPNTTQSMKLLLLHLLHSFIGPAPRTYTLRYATYGSANLLRSLKPFEAVHCRNSKVLSLICAV